jgi:hypothetical protein
LARRRGPTWFARRVPGICDAAALEAAVVRGPQDGVVLAPAAQLQRAARGAL